MKLRGKRQRMDKGRWVRKEGGGGEGKDGETKNS
jgi:hypothetical protein